MVEYYTLFLPRSNREVRIEVSVPRFQSGIQFDTLYLLDGQNAFKDQNSAYGRSIRATKCLSFTAKEMGKRIIGIAIHNSGSDLGRVNEYAPFKIVNSPIEKWNLQDLDELAYFRGDIRRRRYQINWLDEDGNEHSTYAAIRGPVETKINFIQKHGISVDEPNHSVNILMPKNDYTLKYFKRYTKFYS